ncbi:MAG TPA: IS1595 family transposase [Acidobacteriaceae bacterium]|jgi:transposase-like protein|nr:IS1595 family transposase [Acidobacteriaceae bacterium]
MKNMTLQQAILYFSDPMKCVRYMVALRWPDGIVVCPTCGRTDVSWLENQFKWQCKSRHAKRQFSAKVGTIFEDSPLSLDKWLMAAWMLVNCKNGVSSYEIADAIGVTQKSAWFMLHRLRLALHDDFTDMPKLGGEGGTVEVDETFIGGIPKNRHLGKREGKKQQVPVVGILDRNTRQIRAKVVPNVATEALCSHIMDNVGKKSEVFTDGWKSYQNLNLAGFVHDTVNHANQYVNGRVHTQGIENFWSLLKRTIKGSYVAVEPFHLDRYIDEQVFRYNNRQQKPVERFSKALSQIAGKRLTYAEVTGKVGEIPL